MAAMTHGILYAAKHKKMDFVCVFLVVDILSRYYGKHALVRSPRSLHEWLLPSRMMLTPGMNFLPSVSNASLIRLEKLEAESVDAAADAAWRFRASDEEPGRSSRSKKITAAPSRGVRFRAHAQLVLGIRTFYEQEKHFAIPYRFRVPVSAPATPSAPAVTSTWPKDLQGMPLGIKVHRFIQSVIKSNPKKLTKQLNDLQQLGFPWARWKQYLLNEVCFPALETFQALEGHLFVPQKFVVEYGDERWPRSTWGYQLGVQVATLRKQHDSLPQREVQALNALGFIWNVRDAKWDQYFMPGLRRFHELFGHADVPLAFVIPDKIHEDSAKWPPALHGYMLGRHVRMVRSGFYASHAQSSEQELDQLGFAFSTSEKFWTQRILPALQTFAQLYHHCDVPQDFVVPSEAPWPEKAWGSRLGLTVLRIRQGACAAQVTTSQEELERLQFVWSAKHRVELKVRHIVVPAMAAYEKLHGHEQISKYFEVPANDTLYPVQCRGFKLGYWIFRARAGLINLSATHRELLEDVGFVW